MLTLMSLLKWRINDDTKIYSSSINYLLDNGVKSLVLMSHLGDPKKKWSSKGKAGDSFNEHLP